MTAGGAHRMRSGRRPFNTANLLGWWQIDAAHTTLDTGVDTWTSRATQRVLSNATPATQPSRTLADPVANDNGSASFDATNYTLVSDDAAADWTPLSDGSGAVLYVVFWINQGAANGRILGTHGTGNDKGLVLSWFSTTQSVRATIFDGTATAALAETASNSVREETIAIAKVTVSGSDLTIECCDTWATDSGTLPTGTPAETLALGRSAGGNGNALDGTIMAVVAFADDDDHDDCLRHLEREYFCEQGVRHCKCVYRTDKLLTNTSGEASTWGDYTNGGSDLTAAAGHRPDITGNDPAYGARPSLTAGTDGDRLTANNTPGDWNGFANAEQLSNFYICWLGSWTAGSVPLWEGSDTTHIDSVGFGVNSSGNWYVYVSDGGSDQSIDSTVTADSAEHSIEIFIDYENTLIYMWVDNVAVIDGATLTLTMVGGFSVQYCFVQDTGQEGAVVRYAGIAPNGAEANWAPSDYERRVCRQSQRRWARLELSPNFEVPGCFVDLHAIDAVVSGGNVASITDRKGVVTFSPGASQTCAFNITDSDYGNLPSIGTPGVGSQRLDATGSVDFSDTDKVWVLIYGRTGANGTSKIILELGAALSSNPGFALLANNSEHWQVSVRGDTSQSAHLLSTSDSTSAGVVELVGDLSLSTDEAEVYVDGVQGDTQVVDTDNGGNFPDALLHLFGRSDGSLDSLGSICRMQMYKRLPSSKEQEIARAAIVAAA